MQCWLHAALLCAALGLLGTATPAAPASAPGQPATPAGPVPSAGPASPAGPAPPSAPAADDTATVLNADRALLAALDRGDATAARKLLDPRLEWTDLQGRTLAKKAVKQLLPKPADEGAAPQIRLYDRVAVLTAQRDAVHVLRIWIRRRQGWRAIVHQEVEVAPAAAPEPPATGAKAAACDNPCKTVPYRPRSPDEQALLASWQALETAVSTGDASAWAAHVADEFTLVGPARVDDKAARAAAVARGPATPPPLVTANLFDFGDCVIIGAEHQPAGGKPTHVTRVFVNRNGLWLLALSYQTPIEEAATKTQ